MKRSGVIVAVSFRATAFTHTNYYGPCSDPLDPRIDRIFTLAQDRSAYAEVAIVPVYDADEAIAREMRAS